MTRHFARWTIAPIPEPGGASARPGCTVRGVGDALDGTNVRNGCLARRAGRRRVPHGLGGRVVSRRRARGPRRTGSAGRRGGRSRDVNSARDEPRIAAGAHAGPPRGPSDHGLAAHGRHRHRRCARGASCASPGSTCRGWATGGGARFPETAGAGVPAGSRRRPRSTPTSGTGGSTSCGCRSRGRTWSRRAPRGASTRTTSRTCARCKRAVDGLHQPGRRRRPGDGAEQLVAGVRRARERTT